MKASGAFDCEETTIHNLGSDREHLSTLLTRLSSDKTRIFLDKIPTVLANRIESGIAALARREQSADVVFEDGSFDCSPPQKRIPKIQKVSRSRRPVPVPTTPAPLPTASVPVPNPSANPFLLAVPQLPATISQTSAAISQTPAPISQTSAAIPQTPAAISQTPAPIPQPSAPIPQPSAAIPQTSAAIPQTTIPQPLATDSQASVFPPYAEERMIVYAPVSITIHCNGPTMFPVSNSGLWNGLRESAPETAPETTPETTPETKPQTKPETKPEPPGLKLIESMRNAIRQRAYGSAADMATIPMPYSNNREEAVDQTYRIRNVDALYALVGQFHSRQKESIMRSQMAQIEHRRTQMSASNSASITRIRQSEYKATILEKLKRFAYEGEI